MVECCKELGATAEVLNDAYLRWINRRGYSGRAMPHKEGWRWYNSGYDVRDGCYAMPLLIYAYLSKKALYNFDIVLILATRRQAYCLNRIKSSPG